MWLCNPNLIVLKLFPHLLNTDALLDGAKIEVVLAKPVDKGNYVRYTRGAGRGYVQQGLYGYEQQQQQQSSPSYYPGYSNPTGMPPM